MYILGYSIFLYLFRSFISLTSFRPGNKYHHMTESETVNIPPTIIAGIVPIKVADRPALKSPNSFEPVVITE